MRRFVLSALNAAERAALLRRPGQDLSAAAIVAAEVIRAVREGGEPALRDLAARYDGLDRGAPLWVSPAEFAEAAAQTPAPVKAAVTQAARAIERFHGAQVPPVISVETWPGVVCRREWRAIERVGLYVPGGRAPLLSTVLMLGIPARVAGCREVIMATPPRADGRVAPEVLYAAAHAGIDKVLKIGGAQAIAAMALGTLSAPADKIFGPGNRYVTAAKTLVAEPPIGCAIDMIAGPSELLIIADAQANPARAAADLLSQAEHGDDSAVVLVATSAQIIDAVAEAIVRQLEGRQVGASFTAVEAASLDEALAFANDYAPEHLALMIKDAPRAAPLVRNAGAVFVGDTSSVVFGDYAAGTNHTLPTAGAARGAGALVLESFLKPVLFQESAPAGVGPLAAVSRALAEAEGLTLHARAAGYRA